MEYKSNELVNTEIVNKDFVMVALNNEEHLHLMCDGGATVEAKDL